MFFSMKMEKYMESELFGIFPVKMLAKNIVLRSPGTQHGTISAVMSLTEETPKCSESDFSVFLVNLSTTNVPII